MSTVSSYNLRHVFWWSVFDGDSDLFSIWRRLIDMAWLSHPWFLEVPRNVILQARGNPDVHIILRGSENGPNYGFLAIQSPRVFSPWVSMSLKSFGRWSWPIKLNHPRGALIHLGWNLRHSMYKYGIFTHTRYQNTQKLAECRYIYIYLNIPYKWVFLNCLKSKCSAHRIPLPKGETFVAESKERLAKAGFRQTLGVFLLMEGWMKVVYDQWKQDFWMIWLTWTAAKVVHRFWLIAFSSYVTISICHCCRQCWTPDHVDCWCCQPPSPRLSRKFR